MPRPMILPSCTTMAVPCGCMVGRSRVPNFATAVKHDTDFWTEYGDLVNEQFSNWLAR